MKKRSQPGELSVHTDGFSAENAEFLPVVAGVAVQDSLFDLIHLQGDLAGKMVDLLGDMFDDEFEEGGSRRQALTGLQRLARRLDRIQGAPAPRDEVPLGHYEVQEGELVRDATENAAQIGDNAIDATSADVKLQMMVPLHHGVDGCGRKVRNRLQKFASPRFHQVEAEP